jgi:arylsulfatase A-like enzyme
MKPVVFTKPRRFLGLAVLVAAATIPFGGCGRNRSALDADSGASPSVILIVIDTLRADYLGAYRFDGPISTELDALAAESVLFERCSSQAPWTTPSVAAMMTSLYPEAHGVLLAPDDPRTQQAWLDRWTRAIPDSTTTLAEAFRDHGYRTAAFVANPFITGGLGFEQGFRSFDETAAENRDRDSSMLLHAGLRWLRSMESSSDPTFLYLHLMDVHGPYRAPEPDFQAIREAPGLGERRLLDSGDFNRIPIYLRGPEWTEGPDQADLHTWRGRYAAGVHAADRRLGRFFRALRDEGLLDDRVVVVTSDHGEELFDHGGWDHGFNLYEHQLHIPLMIRLPEGRLGGTRVTALVRLVDLMPTLLGLSGADPPPGMVGRDLLPLAEAGDEERPQRHAFSTSVKNRPSTYAVFDGRFKLIADLATRQLMLYDIAADPGERKNLADEESEIVERLGVRLGEEIARVASGETALGQTGEIPQDQLDRLRELGYLQ